MASQRAMTRAEKLQLPPKVLARVAWWRILRYYDTFHFQATLLGSMVA